MLGIPIRRGCGEGEKSCAGGGSREQRSSTFFLFCCPPESLPMWTNCKIGVDGHLHPRDRQPNLRHHAKTKTKRRTHGKLNSPLVVVLLDWRMSPRRHGTRARERERAGVCAHPHQQKKKHERTPANPVLSKGPEVYAPPSELDVVSCSAVASSKKKRPSPTPRSPTLCVYV